MLDEQHTAATPTMDEAAGMKEAAAAKASIDQAGSVLKSLSANMALTRKGGISGKDTAITFTSAAGQESPEMQQFANAMKAFGSQGFTYTYGEDGSATCHVDPNDIRLDELLKRISFRGSKGLGGVVAHR